MALELLVKLRALETLRSNDALPVEDRNLFCSQELTTLLFHEHWRVRKQAAQMLRQEQDRQVIANLADLLYDKTVLMHAREAVVEALNPQDSRGAAVLIAILWNDHQRIVLNAVNNLATSRHQEAVPALTTLLRRSGSEVVRETVVRNFLGKSDHRILLTLEEVMERDPSDRVRQVAAEVLGHQPTPETYALPDLPGDMGSLQHMFVRYDEHRWREAGNLLLKLQRGKELLIQLMRHPET